MKRFSFLFLAFFCFSCIYAKRFTFHVTNNGIEFKVTIDTDKNSFEFYNLDANTQSVGYCEELEAAGKCVLVKLKTGGIRIRYNDRKIDNIVFISFFPRILNTPAKLSMQEGVLSSHYYDFKPADEEDFENTLAEAVKELKRTGRKAQNTN